MLPAMAHRPRVAIVGAGNLGAALALSLHAAHYEIGVVLARSRGASLAKTRRLAARVGAQASPNLSTSSDELVWFCVPDSEIARVAGLAAKQVEWKGRVAFHSSGVLTSDELVTLRNAGAAVASVHPLMTFVGGSHPSFKAVSFAIEGDAAAVRVARRVVRDLGGMPRSIRKADKAAYHAWGTFVSPLLTALLATAERVASLAGVKKSGAARRMLPILRQTLDNYANYGAARGFSGPILRGDVETVSRHLRTLRRTPVIREVYSSLVKASLQYLPARNRKQLMRILDSAD